MATGVSDADLESLLLARRLSGLVPAWPRALVSAGAAVIVMAIMARSAPGGWAWAWSVWAAVIIGLQLARLRRVHTAAAPATPPGPAQRHIERIAHIDRIEAIAWSASFPAAAALGGPAASSAALFAGAIVLLAPLALERGPAPATAFRVVTLATGLALAVWIASPGEVWPYLLLITGSAAALLAQARAERRRLRAAAGEQRDRQVSDRAIARLLDAHEAQAADWPWTLDADLRLCEVSPRLAEALGTTPEELAGADLVSLFEPGESRATLAAALAAGTPVHDLPLRLAPGGTGRDWRLSGHRVAGGTGLWRGTGRDVTQHLPTAARVERMVTTDPLTGLANRHSLEEALRRVPGSDAGGKAAALFVFDLDNFRSVNDTLGPGFGDDLLREMGRRLAEDAQPGDVVARLAGNRFGVLVEPQGGDSLLIGRAHRLLALARAPLRLHGHTARLSTSVGLARAAPGIGAEELLRRAEIALHAAKAKGRDRMMLYEEALDRGARDRRALEIELREALLRDELAIHYQPVIALASGEPVAYEALVRWNHPARGLLMPDQFLHVAEDSGLILTLGAWVIRQALADAAGWEGSFRLAINLSPSQIRDSRLVSTVEGALAMTGFPPERLEFEITEHVLLEDAGKGRRTLERLRSLGVAIALDDFGTGYSSLSYLRRFRFDRVKIDRVFVSDIEHSDEARAIVSAITRLAQALDMQTTAEGVEGTGQLDMLRKLGCDEAQGFLIHRPTDAAAIAASRERGEAFPGAAATLGAYRETRQAVLARPGPRSV